MATKIRWGDTLDDDEVQIQMPQGSVTGPDERGVTTTVEYKRNEKGDIMKITTRVKTSRIQRKVYKVRHPQTSSPRSWHIRAPHATLRGNGEPLRAMNSPMPALALPPRWGGCPVNSAPRTYPSADRPSERTWIQSVRPVVSSEMCRCHEWRFLS